jgi:WhiB family transcriptional regulator, redox-sensing transcriptional regulator
MSRETAWIKDAICSQTDPEVWVSDLPMQPALQRKLKGICNACPVSAECLNYALDNNFIGMWGGTTTSDRRRMNQRNRNRAVSL